MITLQCDKLPDLDGDFSTSDWSRAARWELLWILFRADHITFRIDHANLDVFWSGEPLIGFAHGLWEAVAELERNDESQYSFKDEGHRLRFKKRTANEVVVEADYANIAAATSLDELREAVKSFWSSAVATVLNACPTLAASEAFKELRGEAEA